VRRFFARPGAYSRVPQILPFTNRLRALLGDKFSQGVIWNIVSLGIAGVCGIVVNYLVGEVYGPAALGVFNQVFAVYVVASQLAGP
jgi:O-antigen/teichoic acid export membrane protein